MQTKYETIKLVKTGKQVKQKKRINKQIDEVMDKKVNRQMEIEQQT